MFPIISSGNEMGVLVPSDMSNTASKVIVCGASYPTPSAAVQDSELSYALLPVQYSIGGTTIS
jgi:hypothetical protein